MHMCIRGFDSWLQWVRLQQQIEQLAISASAMTTATLCRRGLGGVDEVTAVICSGLGLLFAHM